VGERGKLGISRQDISRVIAEARAREVIEAIGGMSPFERYVVLDGTPTIYDRVLDEVVTVPTVKLALGSEAFKFWDNGDKKKIPYTHLVFDPTETCPAEYINTFKPDWPKYFKVDGYTEKLPPQDAINFFDGCKNIIKLSLQLCNYDISVWTWPIWLEGVDVFSRACFCGVKNQMGIWDFLFVAIIPKLESLTTQCQLHRWHSHYLIKHPVVNRRRAIKHNIPLKRTHPPNRLNDLPGSRLRDHPRNILAGNAQLAALAHRQRLIGIFGSCPVRSFGFSARGAIALPFPGAQASTASPFSCAICLMLIVALLCGRQYVLQLPCRLRS
jgi:hypothetical protein